MRYSLFYPSCLGFIVGVGIASFSEIDSIASGMIFTILLFLACYFGIAGWHYSKPEAREYSLEYIFIITALACSVGLLRYYFFIHKTEGNNLENYIDQNIEAVGIVTGESDERGSAVRFPVVITEVENVNIAPIKVIVSDHPYSRIKYGDKIHVVGTLMRPENFETESGRVFNYINYLKKDGIRYLMRDADVTVLEVGQGNIFLRLLYLIKNSYIQNLDHVMPFPESRLASGITVAGKRSLPAEVQEDFQKSGTMQVVVLSGYNVTIIAETFAFLMASLPRSYAAVFGSIGIVAFTIMAGGAPTIVRGSVMAELVLIAQMFRRKYDVNRSLLFAAVVMLLYNPMLLAFDPSFQLSFLATVALIHYSPVVVNKLGWLTDRFQLRQTVAATVATQVFVTPYLMYQSGEVSIVALPANMLILFFVPYTMFFSFCAGMMAYVSHWIALVISLPAIFLLKYELFVVNLFASFAFAEVQITPFPIWLLGLSYACFSVIIWRFKIRETHLSRAQIR